MPPDRRRKTARLSLFHKMYHGSSHFRQAHVVPASHIFPRLDHQTKNPIFACTNLYKYFLIVITVSFLRRSIRKWNALPNNIAVSWDYQTFSDRLIILFFIKTPSHSRCTSSSFYQSYHFVVLMHTLLLSNISPFMRCGYFPIAAFCVCVCAIFIWISLVCNAQNNP